MRLCVFLLLLAAACAHNHSHHHHGITKADITMAVMDGFGSAIQQLTAEIEAIFKRTPPPVIEDLNETVVLYDWQDLPPVGLAEDLALAEFLELNRRGGPPAPP